MSILERCIDLETRYMYSPLFDKGKRTKYIEEALKNYKFYSKCIRVLSKKKGKEKLIRRIELLRDKQARDYMYYSSR